MLSLGNVAQEFQTFLFYDLPFDGHELLDFTALVLINVTLSLGCETEFIPLLSFLILTFHQNLGVIVDLCQVFSYDVLVFKSTSHGHVVVPFYSLQ